MTTTTATLEAPAHAEQNARGHLEEIAQLWRLAEWAQDDEPAADLAWPDRARLRELTDKGTDLSPFASRRGRDDLREKIEELAREQALSAEVRDAWRAPGERAEEGESPEEWRILLTWGGPALRLRGDFNQHGEPCSPVLECQDWGTPWIEQETTSEEDEALSWFAGLLLTC